MNLFRNPIQLSMLALCLLACNKQKPDRQYSFNLEESEKYLNQVYHTHPLPGMVVILVSADLSQTLTYGFASLSDSVAFTSRSLFFTGGMSELIVADAMLQMTNQGTLMMTDRVVDRLPYFKTEGAYEDVNIHHLLSHTSGIPHFSPAWDMPSFDVEALSATTRSIIYQPLEFEPGTRVKRSAYNTDIAADLIQHVTDLPFEMAIRDRYLIPRGLHHSSFDFTFIEQSSLVKPHQVGHWLTYEQQEREVYPYTRENVGSYGFHSTADDLSQWIRLMLNTSQNKLFETLYKTSDSTYRGYGWDILNTKNGLVYNNSWGIGGFSGDLSLIPEKKLGVFVLTNTMEDFNPSLLSRQLLDFMHGEVLPDVRPPVHVAMSRMIASGRCMEEVLTWCNAQIDDTESLYEINPTLIGQVGVNLLHRLQMPEEALLVFEFAVQQYPDSPQAFLNLAEGLLTNNQINRAKTAFERAIDLNAQPNAYVSFLRERISVELENQTDT